MQCRPFDVHSYQFDFRSEELLCSALVFMGHGFPETSCPLLHKSQMQVRRLLSPLGCTGVPEACHRRACTQGMRDRQHRLLRCRSCMVGRALHASAFRTGVGCCGMLSQPLPNPNPGPARSSANPSSSPSPPAPAQSPTPAQQFPKYKTSRKTQPDPSPA